MTEIEFKNCKFGPGIPRGRLRWKGVWRYDPRQKIYRLGRWLWQRGHVGDGQGYSAQFSIALTSQVFCFRRGHYEWHLMLCGIRLHYRRAYGGIIV